MRSGYISCLILLIAEARASGWLVHGNQTRHTAHPHTADPHKVTPTLKWAHNAGSAVEASTVLSLDGSLAFAAAAGSNDIFAVHTADGTRAWTYKASGQVVASPTLSDGQVYIGSDDMNFYAIDQTTGKLRWKHQVDGEFTGAAIAVDGLVLAGSGQGSAGQLTAFSPVGKVKWEVKTHGNVASTPSADADAVYFGDDSGVFRKVSLADGSVLWQLDVQMGIRSPPAVHDEFVLFASGDPDGEQAGEVYKVSKQDGSVLWKSGCKGGKHKCDSCWTTPSLVEKTVVLGCGLDIVPRGKVWGLDSETGKVSWVLHFKQDMQTSSPVVQSDGTFLIGSCDQHLYAIDAASGVVKWRWKTQHGQGIWATPAIGSDGTLYIGSHDNRLYALAPGTGEADPLDQSEYQVENQPSEHGSDDEQSEDEDRQQDGL